MTPYVLSVKKTSAHEEKKGVANSCFQTMNRPSSKYSKLYTYIVLYVGKTARFFGVEASIYREIYHAFFADTTILPSNAARKASCRPIGSGSAA